VDGKDRTPDVYGTSKEQTARTSAVGVDLSQSQLFIFGDSMQRNLAAYLVYLLQDPIRCKNNLNSTKKDGTGVFSQKVPDFLKHFKLPPPSDIFEDNTTKTLDRRTAQTWQVRL
jgi:hypothetical protein